MPRMHCWTPACTDGFCRRGRGLDAPPSGYPCQADKRVLFAHELGRRQAASWRACRAGLWHAGTCAPPATLNLSACSLSCLRRHLTPTRTHTPGPAAHSVPRRLHLGTLRVCPPLSYLSASLGPPVAFVLFVGFTLWAFLYLSMASPPGRWAGVLAIPLGSLLWYGREDARAAYR